MLHGKVIRVMWSHRDPDARRSGIGNVFVKVYLFAVTNIIDAELYFLVCLVCGFLVAFVIYLSFGFVAEFE